MRRDGDDRDLALLWAVAPEDAVGTGRAVLNVRLEDLHVRIVGVLDRVIFVCIEARVARVRLEEFNALYDLFEEPFLLRGLCFPGLLSVIERLPRRRFKLVEGIRWLLKPNKR